LEKAGFRIVRQGKHIVMSDGVRILTIPHRNPIHAIIGVVIMFQTLPMPLLHKIAGLELSDVRITLAGTIPWAVSCEMRGCPLMSFVSCCDGSLCPLLGGRDHHDVSSVTTHLPINTSLHRLISCPS
jgi:hypothetical protein